LDVRTVLRPFCPVQEVRDLLQDRHVPLLRPSFGFLKEEHAVTYLVDGAGANMHVPSFAQRAGFGSWSDQFHANLSWKSAAIDS